MKEFSKYVGLDTHKDTIAVAVADAMGEQALNRKVGYAHRGRPRNSVTHECE